MSNSINKSDLVQDVSNRCDFIEVAQTDVAVREILNLICENLASNNRVEIRGFGTFCLHHRKARQGRNPKTGETVVIPAKAIPHFKPGKALREEVNDKWI